MAKKATNKPASHVEAPPTVEAGNPAPASQPRKGAWLSGSATRPKKA